MKSCFIDLKYSWDRMSLGAKEKVSRFGGYTFSLIVTCWRVIFLKQIYLYPESVEWQENESKTMLVKGLGLDDNPIKSRCDWKICEEKVQKPTLASRKTISVFRIRYVKLSIMQTWKNKKWQLKAWCHHPHYKCLHCGGCKWETQAFLSLDAVQLLKTKESHAAVGAPIYCPEPQIRVSAAQCQHGLILPAQYSLVTSLIPTAGAQVTNSPAQGSQSSQRSSYSLGRNFWG